MMDKPTAFPKARVDGTPLKSLTQVLLERRATPHFKPDPVPAAYLEAILELGGQAPSGYNLQPWRLVVVQNEANRRRLQQAAMDQAKVSEAPVVLIAFGIPGESVAEMEEIFAEGTARGLGKPGEVQDQAREARAFLETIPAPAWLNRHTMIAVTTMMLVAEMYGLDTAPMEGFDPAVVKQEFGLPHDAEVVALLAIGYAREPDKGYGGRFPLGRWVHAEHYGIPWGSNP